ncbi:hypothetical protein Bca52824_052034 [Brassica carinata]|uniref:Retrotransposon gag domain-containing protein n=1 Tax=Brassica carinata TaxID=52824 RepID=A0A8X7UJG8_BRACI|nr:hypothetical protein Bca52824_052034 [Brassica carinata]
MDATGTTQAQRIPPIGNSIQDRSLPINQTSIPERVVARVWNPQIREEMTELRGMLSSQIDEIRNQRIANQTIANQLDQAERELAEHRATNVRERNQTPLDLLRGTSNPQNAGLFAGFDNSIEQARRHDLRGPVNIDPQREDLGIPSETAASQNYIERNDVELKRIHAFVHMATSSAIDIDMVIEKTRRTPFTNRIASVRLHHVGKLKFPEYAGNTDPKAHVRAFPPSEPLRVYTNKFREIKAKISHPNEVVALAALKNGIWFSSKFWEDLAVRAPISLDDALHRASYFATHEEEVAALKEQYIENKNNATKKPTAPKEPATKGQHSYAINNSPQKSSTYDLSKYCVFHDRKGHSTEECRAALRSLNENKKTTEETREEEEEPVTAKSNRKAKFSTNKRGRETEQESPSSPPPAPKKRVDMISWGPNNNATDEIKSQTEGKIRFEITVAIRTLENPNS